MYFKGLYFDNFLTSVSQLVLCFFFGTASRTAPDFVSGTKTFAIPLLVWIFVPDVLCLPSLSLLITLQRISHLSYIVVYSLSGSVLHYFINTP